ncbi:RhoGAP-domain-containing protein [Phanerochaete sordida]|uniref:RhoGAP-domain-containing protein n=1 Tax=Phanerochaete sordida TaxID=48140 RepID=A0A9P3L8B4_9APHY|nr:RhoGAP-domain-containing protein [Phanerochaete sordida]
MDSSDSANASPLPPIDGNLRILSDCYLLYFQERRKFEQAHIEALENLSKRLKTIDVYFVDRYDPSLAKNTTREAWAELRNSLDRECETRKDFAASWTSEAIAPLTELKKTHERMRERIRKDIKNSVTAYTSYADSTLPKLKRNYIRKSKEAEDLKAAVADGAPSTSPAVARAKSTGSSIHIPASRAQLSSAAAGALSGLAFHGKRQLGQLKGSLHKTSVPKSEENRAELEQKAQRAKEDAENADKEYRHGVHWLETLRLRRVSVLEGGYQGLEAFSYELSDTLRRILQRFSDELLTACAAQVQSCNQTRSYIDKIDPEKDTSLITEKIPSLVMRAAPNTVLYENFVVGDCRDLIFGINLVDYAISKNFADGDVPQIMQICTGEIENRGLEVEGIYKVPGEEELVQELQLAIERDGEAFKLAPSMDDVHAMSSMLKTYLLKLPEPVFQMSLRDRVRHAHDIKGHNFKDCPLLRPRIQQLPPVHQATLKFLLAHLAKVASHSDKNKMDAKELAIIFGPILFGEDAASGKDNSVRTPASEDTLSEDLIAHADVLFPATSPDPPSSPARPDRPSHVKAASTASLPPPYTEAPNQRTGEQVVLSSAVGSLEKRSDEKPGANSTAEPKTAWPTEKGVDVKVIPCTEEPLSASPSSDALASENAGAAALEKRPLTPLSSPSESTTSLALPSQTTTASKRLSSHSLWLPGPTNASSSSVDLPGSKHHLSIVIPGGSPGFSAARLSESPTPSILTVDSELTPTDSRSGSAGLSAWGSGLSDELRGISQDA